MTATHEPTTSPLTTVTDRLDQSAAESLAGILDVASPAAGDPLPPLWHWVYFLQRSPQRNLGADGHPVDGIPSPPAPGMRRMFAGGRLQTVAPLALGTPARQTTAIVRTDEKSGRSGPLTFVTVRSTITQGDRIVLVEDKDIVYRPGDSRLETPGTQETGDETTPGSGDILLTPDPVLLFRFSAVTYNSHRIHYDAPYAALEGYPGLVVHGPLQVLLMAERLRRDGISFTGRVFSYRLMAPAFSGTRLVVSREDGDGAIGARVHDGRRSTAAATLTEQEDVTDLTPASDGPRASSSQ